MEAGRCRDAKAARESLVRAEATDIRQMDSVDTRNRVRDIRSGDLDPRRRCHANGPYVTP